MHQLFQSRTCFFLAVGFAIEFLLPCGLRGAEPSVDAAEQDARAILEAARVSGGIVVQLGCGDGRLIAALRHEGPFVIHGLDADADAVRRARDHLGSLGVYGPVSIELFGGDRLPFVDNLVNVVVV